MPKEAASASDGWRNASHQHPLCVMHTHKLRASQLHRATLPSSPPSRTAALGFSSPASKTEMFDDEAVARSAHRRPQRQIPQEPGDWRPHLHDSRRERQQDEIASPHVAAPPIKNTSDMDTTPTVNAAVPAGTRANDDKRAGDKLFGPLADFLEAIPTTCPHDHFRKDDDPKARASQASPAFADVSRIIVNRKENAATQNGGTHHSGGRQQQAASRNAAALHAGER